MCLHCCCCCCCCCLPASAIPAPLLPQVFGAGELLVAPLGAALTALGVLIYKHRAALALRGIAATAALSAAFSVATSVAAAKLLGVSTGR
jgi:hypothetical protein